MDNLSEETSPDAQATPPDVGEHQIPASGPGSEEATRNLPWYFGGQGAWFAAMGMQMVIFPYLSAYVLGLDARYIGLAQLAIMGPGLLLLLPGGVIADHMEVRSYLIKLHLVAALPPLLLATILFTDRLTYPLLIGYAVFAGSLTTLAVPARDSLLNHLVEHKDLNRFIALATAVQFGGQLVGMVAAGFAKDIGPGYFFLVHAVLMVVGAASLYRISLPPLEVAHTPLGRDIRRYGSSIFEALHFLFTSRVLAPIMICNSAIGFFYVGSFMVAVPVFVRDVFGGATAQISMLNVSFFIGTVLSALAIMRIGHVKYRGRVMVVGITVGTLICFLMTRDVPFWVFAAIMFVWGLGAGVVMTMSRTIIQEAAPIDMRARLLASFQLGIMGFGPLGALLTGVVIHALGPQKAMFVPCIGMGVTLALVVATTPLWKLTDAATAQ